MCSPYKRLSSVECVPVPVDCAGVRVVPVGAVRGRGPIPLPRSPALSALFVPGAKAFFPPPKSLHDWSAMVCVCDRRGLNDRGPLTCAADVGD